ncbi:hypothetical protein BH09VER1_BH09VER1_51450 [soil metagenome]
MTFEEWGEHKTQPSARPMASPARAMPWCALVLRTPRASVPYTWPSAPAARRRAPYSAPGLRFIVDSSITPTQPCWSEYFTTPSASISTLLPSASRSLM